MKNREWYLNIKNVLELAEFMVESDQITGSRELLEYFKHPEKYTEVWELYQSEIHGKISVSHRTNSTPIPVMLALTSTK